MSWVSVPLWSLFDTSIGLSIILVNLSHLWARQLRLLRYLQRLALLIRYRDRWHLLGRLLNSSLISKSESSKLLLSCLNITQRRISKPTRTSSMPDISNEKRFSSSTDTAPDHRPHNAQTSEADNPYQGGILGKKSPGVQRIEAISAHLTLTDRIFVFFGVFLIANAYGLDGIIRFTYQVRKTNQAL
jgi:hypothetical protein